MFKGISLAFFSFLFSISVYGLDNYNCVDGDCRRNQAPQTDEDFGGSVGSGSARSQISDKKETEVEKLARCQTLRGDTEAFDACMGVGDMTGKAGVVTLPPNSNKNNDPSKKAAQQPGKTEGSQQAGEPAKEQCIEKYSRQVTDAQVGRGECQTNSEETDNVCNINKDSGIKGIVDAVAAVGVGIGTMTMSSAELACSKMGDISQGLNGAVGAFKGYCGKSKSTCEQSCGDSKSNIDQLINEIEKDNSCDNKGTAIAGLKEYLGEIKTYRGKCAGRQQDINMAMQAATNMVGTHMASQKCDQLLSKQNQTFCQQNPNAPICSFSAVVNCNDPNTAKSNPTCICEKDPRNSICANGVGEQTASLERGEAASSIGEGDPTGDALKNASFGSQTPFNTDGAYAGNVSASSNNGRKTEAFGAGARGGGLGGGDGSASYGARKAGGGGSGKTAVPSFGSSGSGGGGSRGGMPMRFGSRPNEEERSGYKYKVAHTNTRGLKGFDLKAHMNSGFQRRGPASCSPAPGIGCADNDIWKVMNYRYKDQRNRLDGW